MRRWDYSDARDDPDVQFSIKLALNDSRSVCADTWSDEALMWILPVGVRIYALSEHAADGYLRQRGATVSDVNGSQYACSRREVWIAGTGFHLHAVAAMYLGASIVRTFDSSEHSQAAHVTWLSLSRVPDCRWNHVVCDLSDFIVLRPCAELPVGSVSLILDPLWNATDGFSYGSSTWRERLATFLDDHPRVTVYARLAKSCRSIAPMPAFTDLFPPDPFNLVFSTSRWVVRRAKLRIRPSGNPQLATV